MTDTLEAFARSTIQDVLATAEATDTTTPEAFTTRLIEHLTDAAEFEDAVACYHSARGVEVSGYASDPDGERLDLFTTHFRQDPVAATLSRTDLDTLIRRLTGFLQRCRKGYAAAAEDDTAVHDMVLRIQEVLGTATTIRMHVFTNSTSRVRTVPVDLPGGPPVVCHVWDIERLHRLLTSGTLQEPIEIDFVERFGRALPCLTTPETDSDYSVLLTILPAAVLDALYGEYGTRLLQLNVRSYLQARGTVNRGIRDTLINHPERFLAYNNGISGTASSVEVRRQDDGSSSIVRVRDLQIVNGGQTTASIHTASRRDRVDLSSVFVQAKLTVVAPESIAAIVPQISRFSNTQNKVTTADFSSNATYHVDTERLSRATWAPSATGDGRETHWFYERARGQYADELARQGTPARQAAWKVSNPTRQKFTKTDLAKFENSYARLPHLVSRGAEKNFYAFMERVADNPVTVDAQTYRDLVAKAVLFRAAERLVTSRQFGGYRANVVTYTIARLASATDSRLDLDSIWRRQGLSPALEHAISDLSGLVQPSITQPPRGGNVGEWCKKPEAWARVEALAWRVPDALAAELLVSRRSQRAPAAETAAPGESETGGGGIIARAAAVPATTWADLVAWAKENDRLTPVQRGLAHTLALRAERGAAPTDRQAENGLRILAAAAGDGFTARSGPAPQDA